MGNELEDSSSEEEEEVKTKESPPEIDDWEAFLYDDDWLKYEPFLLVGSLFQISRCLAFNAKINKKASTQLNRTGHSLMTYLFTVNLHFQK